MSKYATYNNHNNNNINLSNSIINNNNNKIINTPNDNFDRNFPSPTFFTYASPHSCTSAHSFNSFNSPISPPRQYNKTNNNKKTNNNNNKNNNSSMCSNSLTSFINGTRAPHEEPLPCDTPECNWCTFNKNIIFNLEEIEEKEEIEEESKKDYYYYNLQGLTSGEMMTSDLEEVAASISGIFACNSNNMQGINNNINNYYNKKCKSLEKVDGGFEV